MERAGGREVLAGGRPQCEMAARRVADQHGSREVEIVTPGFRTQAVDRTPDVLERARIAAPGLVSAPIANAPDGDPAAGQLWPEVAKLFPPRTLDVLPAATVDQYRDGMRAGTGWEEHVDGLRSRFAIADLQSRCGPWQGDEGGQIDRIGGLDRTCQRKHREHGNQAWRHGTILNVAGGYYSGSTGAWAGLDCSIT